MRRNSTFTRGISLMIALCSVLTLWGQKSQSAPATNFKPVESRLWINTYGNIRITDKLSWIAQTHFRFREGNDLKFAGQIGQIYNRHALSYRFSKTFNASLGGVLRVNFNTYDLSEGEESVVPEYRIWHEYLFLVPLERLNIYHRIRLEHRWSRGFGTNSSFIFRNRWRYMVNVKIPVNKPKLGPATFYISPEAELIMQSGKAVGNSPLEDLRLHASFGYVLSPQVTLATGLMYSMGQKLGYGDIYHQKLTIRTHLYFSPDLRRIQHRIPLLK